MGFRNLGLGTVELKGTRILRAGFSRDAGPGISTQAQADLVSHCDALRKVGKMSTRLQQT